MMGDLFRMSALHHDAPPCSICGTLLWRGVFHACGGTPARPIPLRPMCEHCYCQKTPANAVGVLGPAHRICCNCGNRQAMGVF